MVLAPAPATQAISRKTIRPQAHAWGLLIPGFSFKKKKALKLPEHEKSACELLAGVQASYPTIQPSDNRTRGPFWCRGHFYTHPRAGFLLWFRDDQTAQRNSQRGRPRFE